MGASWSWANSFSSVLGSYHAGVQEEQPGAAQMQSVVERIVVNSMAEVSVESREGCVYG